MCHFWSTLVCIHLEHHCKAKGNWNDYCDCKEVGGLGLIDLEKALSTLMCKWVLLALEPNDSNLKTLLHFKLVICMPSQHRRWILNLNLALVQGHVFALGFKIWGQIMQTQKRMVNKFHF
jgi:hypothetical protein